MPINAENWISRVIENKENITNVIAEKETKSKPNHETGWMDTDTTGRQWITFEIVKKR
ncbi:hypothetical protein HUG15_05555 [Salicibibacter cibarius]|uniref:Uncharacterized protein n=1 Tax=Salicibibacter cibarius TaxID=2743000 RepID=A0A7T6Z136_9BACI|nr:hypothetical protein [Salicibibacter cibarius]QQK75060.1 hypothetical protein HUG15_05220 [Salicibibacter cibarius]QQK75122.1 hypothetical protein HUG15_05555 [Salicibibacter cibarius]